MPFHPCGQVMDMIRVAYKTKMKLWADSDELTEVRWFRAKPDAKSFDGRSFFRSNFTWGKFYDKDPKLGETDREEFTYDKGANPVGYDGKHRCGREQALRTGGVHGVDPPLTCDADGNLPCCGVIPPDRTCFPTLVGEIDIPLPGTVRFRVIDNGNCSGYAGVDWTLDFAGVGPITMADDPLEEEYFTGLNCRWWFASGYRFIGPGAGGTSLWMGVALGMFNHHDERDPLCLISSCGQPGFFLREYIVRSDGTVQAQQQMNLLDMDWEVVTVTPLVIKASRDTTISSIIVSCQLAQPSPVGRTEFWFDLG